MSAWTPLQEIHNMILSSPVVLNLEQRVPLPIHSTLGKLGNVQDYCGGAEQCAIGISWVEARHAAENPTWHRIIPLKRMIEAKITVVLRLETDKP